jgi:dihydroxyacid dehydratase/phosphogluconate dehydratase
MSDHKRPTHQTRSGAFFDQEGVGGFVHRAFTKSMGFDDADIGKPVIGICNTYSEVNNCNRHLREVAEAVKRGVWQSGGLPLEFPTISLGEVYLSPTSMLYRNLAAMDTEEMIRGQPLDGVVLLVGCDKTVSAADHGQRRPNAQRQLSRPDTGRLHRLPPPDRRVSRRQPRRGDLQRHRG